MAHATMLRCESLCAAIRAELAQPQEPFRPVSADELGWKKYLPIRKMTAEEYERHLLRKAKREENRYMSVVVRRRPPKVFVRPSAMMLTG